MSSTFLPLHCKILKSDVCEFQTVKQPCIKPIRVQHNISQQLHSHDSSMSSSSFLSDHQNEISEPINTSVITIQTFNLNSKFIISTCYMQDEQKFSCNYSYDKDHYETFQLIPLEIKLAKGTSSSSSSQQDAYYPQPRKMIKSENKIQQSKNAAKNITKAFIRYFKDQVGEADKNYKDLVKFIKKHKYNNKNLKIIAQKPLYAKEFKAFCNGPAQKWVDTCEIQDKDMHSRIIEAFKNSDYEMLKEHKKRIKKRYSF